MITSVPLTFRVLASPLRGTAMLVASTAAVVAPTLVRTLIHDSEGEAFCAYVPFVVLAAMALDWRAATAVAAVSGFLAACLFEGTRLQVFDARCATTGTIFFGFAALLIIGFAHAARKSSIAPRTSRTVAGTSHRLVFSREGGQALVSWHGGESFVPLGPADEVEEMMRDFLAQQEVGRRLSRGRDSTR